jgi:hypothetical protein
MNSLETYGSLSSIDLNSEAGNVHVSSCWTYDQSYILCVNMIGMEGKIKEEKGEIECNKFMKTGSPDKGKKAKDVNFPNNYLNVT